MSTAVPTPVAPASPPMSDRAKLVSASVFGALIVLGGLAVAGYFVPTLWEKYVAPVLGQGLGFVNVALRLLAQLASAGVVIFIGTRLAGSNPPRGIRGGIFLVISLLFTDFFIIRAVGLNLETSSVGPMITLSVGLILAFLTVRFLLGDRANRYMIDLEHAGWFHANFFKQTQGISLRRYTLAGVLILGLSGVYSLREHGHITVGELALKIPFTGEPGFHLPVLPDAELALPMLLVAAVVWFGWRLVNVPAFADFLINTEAEMNKVSWSTRKRLVQDTIVVLVTVTILTVFLLAIDLFWGWLLSREIIHVLPPSTQKAGNTQNQTEDW